MLRISAILVFAAMLADLQQARCEEFAKPPMWSDEVKNIFFDDARTALSGEPPTEIDGIEATPPNEKTEPAEQEVWQELIASATLESAVKGMVLKLNSVLRSMEHPARSQEARPSECRRDLTLLGTLFQVIASYPDDVRWKSIAPQISQMCLNTAESYAGATHVGVKELKDAYVKLEDALRGQTDITTEPNVKPHVPDFAPLMQCMKLIAEEGLPEALSKKANFRRSMVSIDEQTQILAMLSQVIRGEEYGYADDATYQRHADNLRDAAQRLQKAALANEFQESVDAAAAINQACAKCHADYRG
jgi:hypothetical protein